jgi:hypothetical protein
MRKIRQPTVENRDAGPPGSQKNKGMSEIYPGAGVFPQTVGDLDTFKVRAHFRNCGRLVSSREAIAAARILEAVEAVKGFEGKSLSAIQARFWKPINAYVHSGFQQIVPHQTEEAIEVVNDPRRYRSIDV